MQLRSKQLVAIFLSVAMVSSVIVTYEVASKRVRRPLISFGPKLLVSAPSSNLSANNSSTSTVTLQIYSTLPNSFGISGRSSFNLLESKQSNNSRYVELVNASLKSNSSTIILPNEFNLISNQWRDLFSSYSGSNIPSLAVVSHKTLYNGNNVSIYSYYNNLQYNPLKDNIETSTNFTQLDNWFNGTGIDPSNYSQIRFADTSLHLGLVFPKNPSQIIHVEPENQTIQYPAELNLTPYTQCPNFYYNRTVYTTSEVTDSVNYTDSQDMHSPVILPLLGLHFSSAVSSGKSWINFYSSILISNDRIAFNSANAYQPVSGEVSTSMSTNPSYSHTANVSTGTAINGTSIVPMGLSEKNGASDSSAVNGTTGVTGIANVTYAFVHYTKYTYQYKNEYEGVWNPTCEYFTTHFVKQMHIGKSLDGNGTTAEISTIQSVSGLKIIAEDVPIEINSVIHSLLEGSSNGTLTLNYTGENDSYQASAVWADTYGYSNAASVIKSNSDALAIFSSSLELGLAVSDTLAAANGIDGDTTEPSIVADSLSMIAETTALTGDVLDLFSTISFVSGSNTVNLAYGFSSYSFPGTLGSNYSMQYYESQYPMTFTTSDGSTYSFYAPTDYLNATNILSN